MKADWSIVVYATKLQYATCSAELHTATLSHDSFATKLQTDTDKGVASV